MVKIFRGLVAVAAGLGAIAPSVSLAAPANAGETVFVMTNDANNNEVVAFQRTYNGQFQEGQHYRTNGRGSGGTTDPLGAQGSLTLSTDHSLLFAANAGSGTISVFYTFRNQLFLADNEPSGGSEPVAIAQRNNFVYVLNAAGSGSVVPFTIDQLGHLKPIKNATKYLTASGAGGASIAISPNGQFLIVTERVANNVDVFKIQPNGTLSAAVVNPSPGPGAFSGAFAPDGKLVVSETGPAGGVNAAAISSYSVQPNGSIAPITQSLPTLGGANCWNAITPDGKYVYVSNAGSSTIAGFSIGKNGSLAPIGSTIVAANPNGAGNLDIAISGDGQYLFSLNSGAGAVGVFEIQKDGTLQNLGEVEGLPKTAGLNGIASL